MLKPGPDIEDKIKIGLPYDDGADMLKALRTQADGAISPATHARTMKILIEAGVYTKDGKLNSLGDCRAGRSWYNTTVNNSNPMNGENDIEREYTQASTEGIAMSDFDMHLEMLEGEKDETFKVGSLKEATKKVQEQTGKVRSAMGVPTKEEIERSDKRIPTVMCTPWLAAADFLEKTKGGKVIILVTFASGAMPGHLEEPVKQRLHEGIPVILVSDNSRNVHGILGVAYAAGKGIYEAGALPLQKVNVMDIARVKAVIKKCLDTAKTPKGILDELDDRYSYKEGEKMPLTNWEYPTKKQPGKGGLSSKGIEEMLRDGGFTDEKGKFIPKSDLPPLPPAF